MQLLGLSPVMVVKSVVTSSVVIEVKASCYVEQNIETYNGRNQVHSIGQSFQGGHCLGGLLE